MTKQKYYTDKRHPRHLITYIRRQWRQNRVCNIFFFLFYFSTNYFWLLFYYKLKFCLQTNSVKFLINTIGDKNKKQTISIHIL